MDLLLFSQSFSNLQQDQSFITSFAFGAALAWLNTDGAQSTFSRLPEHLPEEKNQKIMWRVNHWNSIKNIKKKNLSWLHQNKKIVNLSFFKN